MMENPAPLKSADKMVKAIKSADDTTDTSPPPPPCTVVAGERLITVVGSVPVAVLDGIGISFLLKTVCRLRNNILLQLRLLDLTAPYLKRRLLTQQGFL